MSFFEALHRAFSSKFLAPSPLLPSSQFGPGNWIENAPGTSDLSSLPCVSVQSDWFAGYYAGIMGKQRPAHAASCPSRDVHAVAMHDARKNEAAALPPVPVVCVLLRGVKPARPTHPRLASPPRPVPRSVVLQIARHVDAPCACSPSGCSRRAAFLRVPLASPWPAGRWTLSRASRFVRAALTTPSWCTIALVSMRAARDLL
ncbi:hypothetical protein C8R47DRAFT_1063084 [Mycena vitilis]|nr:hypothetical protein C8R47DRAFT_1063084 [Mycena vitilis]